MRSRPFSFNVLVVAALAGPAAAGELQFGASGVLGLPRGAFDRDAGEAYGLAGYMTWGPKHGALRLRVEAGAEIYGSQTRRVPVSSTLNRITAEQTTDNWIGSLTAGPELTLGRGPVAPYLHAFGGASYFATTSEARLGYDPLPFVSATNHEDTTVTWGGEAGLRFALGRALALDVGARYTGHGEVTYLAEGDLRDVPGGVAFATRRSEPRVLEVRVGVRFR
jgi:opacity protein-like surface antigen